MTAVGILRWTVIPFANTCLRSYASLFSFWCAVGLHAPVSPSQGAIAKSARAAGFAPPSAERYSGEVATGVRGEFLFCFVL